MTVILYRDANNSGTLDATDPIADTKVTNSSGYYQFTGVAAGAYYVKVDTSDADFPLSKVTQTADPDEAGACSTCNNQGRLGSATTAPAATRTRTLATSRWAAARLAT